MAIRSSSPVEEAEALLRRGTAITSEQLVRLIHEVNPTSRGLRDSERRRRYALKARLQSLLIARFPSELSVVPGDEPGVVSILHRHTSMDACHAIIDELEEDARSWIKSQLDVGNNGEVSRPESTAPRSTLRSSERSVTERADDATTLVCAGRAAVAEYDFEQATICFEQALKSSHGAIEPARALFELWIDQMGSDIDALALEASLPKATLADMDVRALLGIAAARTKDLRRAERLIRGLETPRLAEIVALCARAACETADPAVASLWVAQLRSCDSMHPALLECERALRKFRDDERLASEAELHRHLENNAFDEAERCAQSLLVRWPQSEVAARWLLQHRSERANQAADRALEQAAHRRARGALREASLILTSALVAELDQDRKGLLKARIAELESQLREVAENQQLCDVVSAFEGSLAAAGERLHNPQKLEAALDLYLDLAVELRERIREQLDRLELAWVEPLLARYGTRRAKSAAIAVLTLLNHRVELERHPTETLERLAPHLEALDAIPESHKLLTVARQAVRLERKSIAVEQLRQAEDAVDQADWARALRMLEGIVGEDLEAGDRGCSLELLSSVRASIQLKNLETQLGQLHSDGELFAARGIAVELAQRSEGDEHKAWLGRRDALRSEIAQAFHCESGSCAIGEFWFAGLDLSHSYSAPEPWVNPDGNIVIGAVSAGRWLLVVRCRIDTMQIESWARFLLPKETKRVSVKRVTDEVVVLATEEDDTLSLDLHTWELLAFHANKLTENWRTEECVVSRDARWFWRAQEKAHGPYQERRVQVLELSTQRCVREIGEADSLFTVIGSHAAEIGIVRDSSTSMHYSRGAPVSGYVAKEWLTSAVQAPSGEGLVGAYADESRDGVLVLLGPIGPGSPRRETVIEGSSGEAIHQLAVALEHGILVVWYFADQAYWLETFVEQQGHLKSQYRSEVSKGALLLTDRNGRRVWLIGSDDGKPVSREITREPRYFVFDEAPRRYLRHFSMELWDCYGGHQSDETDPPASPITTAAGVWRVVKDAQMGGAVGPERLHSELQRIRVTSGLYHVAELLKLALVWAFPRDAAMLLARADSFASLEQWGNVHRSLRTLNLEKVPEYRKQHAYHLLALCALMGLDFDAARELRRSAVGLDGNCDWSLINELTQENLDWELGNPQDEPLDELEDEPEDEKRQNSGILALRRALRDADALLAVGNPRAAFAAAAVPELLHWDDERLLACASEALLQFEPEGIGERLRREYIVSAFLALARDRFAHRYLLPVKEAWDAGRIAAVRERAIRQFERDTGALPALGIGAIAPIRIEREFADGALVLEWPPLLAHERLLELHPGLLQGFSELLEKLSSDRSEGLAAVFDEGELLADPRVWSIAEAERARLVREEVPAPTAVHKLDELGPHLAYLMNHSLAGRRSYWVTEDLARQLRAPDPSVSAQRLAESTKCHCFAFADADTLCIAEKLVAHDRQCPLAGKRLAVLTAYTWSTASESEPPMLAVRLLFVPETEAMAYRVAREIECDRAVDFDTVLNSHRSDRLEAALDPLVDAPELEVLLAMVLRALLQVSAPGAEVRDLGKRSGGKSVKLPSPLGLDGETLRMGANTGYTGDHVLQMLGSVRMGNSD